MSKSIELSSGQAVEAKHDILHAAHEVFHSAGSVFNSLKDDAFRAAQSGTAELAKLGFPNITMSDSTATPSGGMPLTAQQTETHARLETSHAPENVTHPLSHSGSEKLTAPNELTHNSDRSLNPVYMGDGMIQEPEAFHEWILRQRTTSSSTSSD